MNPSDREWVAFGRDVFGRILPYPNERAPLVLRGPDIESVRRAAWHQNVPVAIDFMRREEFAFGFPNIRLPKPNP